MGRKILAMTASLLALMAVLICASAADGITNRINALRSKFPEGMYWNHQRKVNGDDGDTLLSNWNNAYGDSVTSTPCATHNGVAAIGQYDCNAFDGAIQCYGFANKVFFDIFGQHCPNLAKRTDIANIAIGDHIRITSWEESGHSAVVIARSGNTLTLVEGNYVNNCMIHWGRTININSVIGFYHASNWQEIYNDGNTPPTLTLDAATGGTGQVTVQGWAFDPDSPSTSLSIHIYAREGSNQPVYTGQTVANNIRPDVNNIYGCGNNHGFEATISTDLVGTYTIMAAALDTKEGGDRATWKEINNVRIDRQTYATLDVNGLLDGQESGGTDGYGTFDVYIGGKQVADDASDYYDNTLEIGKSYEIKDIRPVGSHTYDGVKGELKGTVTASGTSVRLIFSTKLIPTSEWQEVDSLPSNLDLSGCEVEYNNHYKKTSPTSPGSGWTRGAGTTTYVDDGYEVSDFELATSATRVLQSTYYYHYCGATAGNRVNFAQNGTYTDYHEAGVVSAFNVVGEWTDDDDARYHSYKLTWKSGQWAGGDATCAGGRSAIWYKRYKYLKRKAVTNYIWTRDSGWTTSKDSSADSVTYRFRLASGRTLVLPANVKVIGEQAFAGTDASVITIPNGCTTIGSQAFLNCKNLTRLNIPASVTSIAYDAFNGCDNLVIYAPQGSMAISRASSLGIKYQVTQ